VVVVGFQAKKERPVGARPLVAWGFEGCTTQPAVAAGLAGSEASAIRAGYRKAQLTAHHVEHVYILALAPFWVYGPADLQARYGSTSR
jgi:hypothetical protein